MEQGQKENETGRKRRIFSSIFPQAHDFEGMLAEQAERTLEGVHTLVIWLNAETQEEPRHLDEIEEEVDQFRLRMEDKLIQSFSTPFDRQDIYSLSRQMDYILNFSNETAQEMYAFGVKPDGPIREMGQALLLGTECVALAVKIMGTDKRRAEKLIHEARGAMRDIEEEYIRSMASLLHTDDAMAALRKREIYHHLRDAGRALRNTMDILHNALVGLP
jgi:uncharacterized protein Yka (UPF0111/DUF47 family)